MPSRLWMPDLSSDPKDPRLPGLEAVETWNFALKVRQLLMFGRCAAQESAHKHLASVD